ncbi:DUF5801 repeats-in-toxin domain-containing protein [Altererythrobacter arenosus]|uniref:DUF5801 repeats-in-toxin domain-containing protein n=1 Tax=Altererythrobacter arenosus TaxID=3032592 RepID=A0ABY8FNN3_9SPHN|nr:DUF5801 repeats-in-toxin domain-containing protein [Altererythrobacter sp. CAU 1644]WFL76632.1 DUF5801 repeats-in-toxin domain-containing protein [Altererythrobacter sp. CAU 1644]
MVDFESGKSGGFDLEGAPDNSLDTGSSQYQDAGASYSPGTGILQADANGVVVLPAGVSLEDITVRGTDLVITLADGTEMVIPGGALIVPQFVVDGVVIAPQTVSDYLNGIDPEAGPQAQTPSSGGNFAADEGAIQDAFDRGDLLPYTELNRTIEQEEEILPFVDEDPVVVIETPDNPIGVENAIARVFETGLPGNGDGEGERNEPPGVGENADGNPGNDSDTSDSTSGTIVFAAPDGLSAILINGVEITTVGQQFVSPVGTLTITSIDLDSGEVGFSYQLQDNLLGETVDGFFAVTVVDRDGDTADATLSIIVEDDGPRAEIDNGTIEPGTFGPIEGNVLDNDESGADGYPVGEDGIEAVTGFSSDNAGGSAAPGASLQGQYGVLTLNADGTYEYTRDFNTPGGVTDTFTYTIVDQDGSEAEAKLVITIENAPNTIDFVPTTGEGTQVDEGGLPPRTDEPVGTGEGADDNPNNNSDPSETTGATIEFNSPDGLASITINGVEVDLNNQAGNDADDQIVIDDETGTLVITAVTYDPTTGDGTISYEYTLGDNTSGDDTEVEFEIIVTDLDGDKAEDTLVIEIVDDEPEAANDVAGQVNENQPIIIDALDNDVFGADDVDTSDATKVFVSTQGSQGTASYDPATGLFTYTPNPGAGSNGNLTDSFQYTIIDGDGDPSIATVNFTLQPDSEPRGSERVATVDDDGLADGNPASTTGDLAANTGDDPADTSEASFTGTLGFDVGNDTPATISVDPALAGTTDTVGTETVTYSVSGGTLTATITGGARDGTDLFTVEITDAATGAYQVTLLTNVFHASGNDENDASVSIDFLVADSEGETAPTNLTIIFDDDAPTAVADVDSVTEDGPLVADGNVLTGSGGSDANATDGVADAQGADGASVTGLAFGQILGTVGSPLTSTYGKLTIDANGDYRYELDNTNPLVQGLDSTESLTEIFTYTITDADGDTSETTLTITINGADDGVTVNGLDLAAPELVVDEDDLADGTSPDAAALTKTGSFTVDSPDGLATLTVGGVLVYDADNPTIYPVTIDNPTYGQLTITNVVPVFDANGDAVTAEVFFSYTLQDNSLLHDESGEDNFIDSFEVVATDTDGSTNSPTSFLDIQVIDDVPSVTLNSGQAPVLATDDTDLRNNPSSTDTGNFSTLFTPDFQADGPNAVDSLVYAVAITGGNGTDSGLDDTATGNDILLRLNGNVIEGYLSGDPTEVAFTLSLDPATGVITQTQFRAIEHDNPADSFETGVEAETMAAGLITITATVTDGDGDQASETAEIGDAFTFEDDGPVRISLSIGDLDEDALASGNNDAQPGDDDGGVSFTGSLDLQFGADGPAADELTIAIDSVFSRDPDGAPVALSSGGATVLTVWNADTNTLTGYTTDVGDPVYTLVVDLANLQYTFTLFKPLDHPSQDDGSGTLEGYEDNLGLYLDITITDGDGDSITLDGSNFVALFDAFLNIDDDMAVATDNANTVGEGEATDGNVITDDDGGNGLDTAGADGYAADGPVVDAGFSSSNPAGVTLINKSVALDGTITLTTSVGTLVIGADGDYTFTSVANTVNSNTDLTFTYTIEDGDGDRDTADLVIGITNVAGSVSDQDIDVDEKGLADGTGELADNVPNNDQSEIDANGLISVNGATGPFKFILVGGVFDDKGTASTSDDTYTIDGMYGTIVLNASTGAYTYTLDTEFDHDPPLSGADRNEEPIAESFAYRVEDLSGNEIGTGDLDVTIIDDIPVITAALDTGSTVTVDETDLAEAAATINLDTYDQGADSDVSANPTLIGSATTDNVLDVSVLFGADGPAAGGGLSYSLNVANATSGMTTTEGTPIVLVKVSDTVVVGVVQGTNTAAFAIEIDAGNGEITVEQYLSLDHGVNPDPNEPEQLATGSLTATVTAEDFDGDSVDATAVDITSLITFRDDGPTAEPTLTAFLDDDALGGNANGPDDQSPDTANLTGTLVDPTLGFGNDGGSVAFDLTSTLPSGYRLVADPLSDGVIIEQEQGTGNWVPVVRVALDGTTGNYTVSQLDNIWHENDGQNDENEVSFTLGATLTDGDEDTATTSLTITVDDDTAVANAVTSSGTVDEDGLQPDGIADNGSNDMLGAATEATGSVAGLFTAGADGPLTYALDDTSTAALDALGLESNGVTVTYVINGDTVTATAGGSPVFTFTLNDPASGDWKFVLEGPLDHDDTNDSENVVDIDIDFGSLVYATDIDGDRTDAIGSVVVTVDDDTPRANADVDNVTEGSSTTGNVLDGTGGNVGSALQADEGGADGLESPAIVGIASTNQGTSDTTVTAGEFQLAGEFGTLTLNQNGTYTYAVAGNSVTTGGNDVFTYTIVDNDGDEVSTTLTFAVTPVNLSGNAPSVTVYEEALDDTVDAGDVAAGTIFGSAPAETTESANGTVVVAGATAFGIQGGTSSAGFTTLAGSFGTIRINETTGQFTYTLTAPVETTPNDNDGVTTEFGEAFTYTATDGNGNTTTGTITVNVVDDVPTLGTIQDQQASNDPTQTPAVGTLNFEAGADDTGATMVITADTTGITSGGRPLVTEQVGNVLTAYIDADSDGVLDPGETTAVFTLTVNPDAGASGQYTFDLITALDPTITDVPIGSGSSFGVGPTNSVLVNEFSDESGRDLVLVTAWSAGPGFNKNDPSTWSNAIQQSDVNGSTQGWGRGNNNFDQDEFLRFDFGDANDYDGAGSYVPPTTDGRTPPSPLDIADVSYATFSFFNFQQTGGNPKQNEIITFVAHYTDNTSQTFVIDGTTDTGSFTITAPAGTFIDYVDAYMTTGEMKLNLTNVGVADSSIDKTINFSLQLTDGDGDTTSTQDFSVRVADGLTPFAPAAPIVLDLDGGGADFSSLAAGIAYDYDGDGVKTKTAWMAAGSAILAYDMNADGFVNNASEFVFGSDGVTDLEAVAALYDDNGDGVLDAQDAAYESFGLWIDADLDAVSDAGEFVSLKDAGITSIELVSDGNVFAAADGDVTVFGTASYTMADGSTGEVADAAFMTAGDVDGTMEALLALAANDTAADDGATKSTQDLPEVEAVLDDALAGTEVDNLIDHFTGDQGEYFAVNDAGGYLGNDALNFSIDGGAFAFDNGTMAELHEDAAALAAASA